MSTLVAQTISNGTVSTSSANVIQGSAKAWVNFDGTAGTVRTSYNVSSITRNGTGTYTVNFTNAFADANYAPIGMCGNATTSVTNSVNRTASTCQINTVAFNIASPFQFDVTEIFVAFFR
jgi:hypothetical protein